MVDVSVVTSPGSQNVISDANVAEFRAILRGPLLTPADAGYESPRHIWNGMIDKRPALIARCAGAADVIRCVNFAREHQLLVSIKGGGHSFPGHSVCNDGLMIDLSTMKSVRVDPQNRLARVEPGVTWGEFDREAHAFGLGVTGGQISHTEVAGLTLGGGFGWLARKYGLTCDNLRSVDIITADGKLLKASESENADLFWGIRGGGGKFGVVTSFEFQLHPASMIIGGLVAHPLPQAKAAMQFFREYAGTAPDELGLTGAFLTTLDGHAAFGILVCYAGDLQKGEKIVQPVKEFGPPVMDHVGPMPYPMIQSIIDQAAVPDHRYYMRSYMLDEISDETINILTDYFARVPSPFSAVIIVQLGGEVSRRPADSTAYYHREAAYSITIFSCWVEPEQDEQNIAWTREFGDAIRPLSSGGVYVNELTEEGEARIQAAYGPETYRRLVDLKKKYDPTNLFRMNQNIRPAG